MAELVPAIRRGPVLVAMAVTSSAMTVESTTHIGCGLWDLVKSTSERNSRQLWNITVNALQYCDGSK
jgi:hypothetical protein